MPTLAAFAPGFIERYAIANRQKPSSIASKATIIRAHLPVLGSKQLDAIGNEDVQALKARFRDKAPKTLNNALSTRSIMLKAAMA